MQKPTKPGDVKITPVGHTYSGLHGSTPLAQPIVGGKEPTPQTFGK